MTYTVVSGDTLSKISQKLFGTTANWRALYDNNVSVIGANPDLIRVGQVLQIPMMLAGSVTTQTTTAYSTPSTSVPALPGYTAPPQPTSGGIMDQIKAILSNKTYLMVGGAVVAAIVAALVLNKKRR